MKIIEVNNLYKFFKTGFTGRKRCILNNLSLSVEKGEIYGLLGPNGAGKTTTLKILTGLLNFNSGTIKISGEDIKLKQKIGFLPENPYFHDFLTGNEFLNFHAKLLGGPINNEKIKELFKLVGLAGAEYKKLRTYSKGMIQRIGIAQALIGDPQILIFDEPMSGLDPIGRRDLREIILNLKEKQKTILFSTHILPDVEVICDRIGVILNGALKGEGKLETLIGSKIKYYEITAKGLQENIKSDIKNMASKTLERGEKTLFYLERDEYIDEILKKIIDNGGRVVSLIPNMETLEEYFIREFGKEWEQ